MKQKITTMIVSGVLLAVATPALSQADDEAQQERERQLQAQQEEAIRELFRDLQLDVDELDDPNERLLEDREQLQEIQRRIIRLQREQPLNLREPRLQGPEVELDAKDYVNPFAEKPREEVVAALGHEDFAVRESAEAFLLTDNTLGQAALKELIEQAESREACHRLLRVAEHHVLREMRERDFGAGAIEVDPEQPLAAAQRQSASIGYSYEPVMAHENTQAKLPGVRVIATMPGFPGYAHLREGDIIVQIAGQGLSINHQHHDITNWVRWRISAHAAGDTMQLTVLRDGELMKVELVCAQGAALDAMYTTDAFETAARKEPYKRQWQQVRDDLVAGFPKPKTLTPKPAQ